MLSRLPLHKTALILLTTLLCALYIYANIKITSYYKFNLNLLKDIYYVQGFAGTMIGIFLHTVLWLWLTVWDENISPIWYIGTRILNFNPTIKKNILENLKMKSEQTNIEGGDFFISLIYTMCHHFTGGG